MPTEALELLDHKFQYSFELVDLYTEWGPGHGEACWEFWICEPCCGTPCNVSEGAYCCLNWCFCGACNAPYLIAYGLDQRCAFQNHCCPILVGYGLSLVPIIGCCLGYPVLCFLGSHYRANLRMKAPIGTDECQCGDCLMQGIPIVNIFAACQNIRSVHKNEEGYFPWDALAVCQRQGFAETYITWDRGDPFYHSREEFRLYPGGQHPLPPGDGSQTAGGPPSQQSQPSQKQPQYDQQQQPQQQQQQQDYQQQQPPPQEYQTQPPPQHTPPPQEQQNGQPPEW